MRFQIGGAPEFKAIGGIAQYVTSGKGAKTLDEAWSRLTTMAAAGIGSQTAQIPFALNAVIGARFKVIAGYSGAGNVMLAVERGEVEGICSTWTSLKKFLHSGFQQKRPHFFVQFGLRKREPLPAVPLALDLAKNANDRHLLDLLAAPNSIVAPLAPPPGLPEEKVEIWRAAFEKTVDDPKFLAEGKRLQLTIESHRWGENRSIVQRIYSLPPAVSALGRKVFSLH